MIVKRILPLLVLAIAATALPAQLLAGEFNKPKNTVKQKRGVTARKFHEVRSET